MFRFYGSVLIWSSLPFPVYQAMTLKWTAW